MNNQFWELQKAKAKAVEIEEVLSKLGYRPLKKASQKFTFYENPLRNDKNPSFAVKTSENRCYDFGATEVNSKKGYDGIDLVMRVNNCSFFEALGFILGLETTKFPTDKEKELTPATQGKGIEVLKAIRLEKNRFLLDYLGKRKINLRYAKACEKVFEVYYTVDGKYKDNGKPYFALGFENESKGFELRTNSEKVPKLTIGTKDVSFIPHPFSRKIVVFEGFIDYLSALTHYGKIKSDHAVLVLNSVTNREKALPILRDYEQSLCFLDTDQGGLDCLDYFKKQGLACLDKSDLYKGYKDFNEFLCR